VSSGEEAVAAVRQTRLANLWVADARGGELRQITSVTSPEGSPFDLAVADSGSVVYSAPRDQNLQIWSTPAGGGPPTALTSGAGLSVSSNGAQGVIVFMRIDAGGMHLWRMGPDGSNLRQITSGPGERLNWLSPDGRFAVFTRVDSLAVTWLLSVESGEVSRVASGPDGNLGFSPDGRFLLVVRYGQAQRGMVEPVWYALPIAGGDSGPDLRLPGTSSNPGWGPDSHGMAFLNTADPAWNVYRKDFGGGEPVPVTHFTDGRVRSYGWSPDGSKLAIARRDGSATNAWITEADGSHPIQVTHFAAEEIFEMKWMPDSRRLVVEAGTSSRDAVLIRDFR
jgi:Tol biopolymer transport system component